MLNLVLFKFKTTQDVQVCSGLLDFFVNETDRTYLDRWVCFAPPLTSCFYSRAQSFSRLYCLLDYVTEDANTPV
jgi:hypothetical protein